MQRIIIIDDEPSARSMIAKLVKVYLPDAEIVAEAHSVDDGYNKIIKFDPDLVFLDIKMPDGTGFSLLEKLKVINFKVIFITAFEEFAVKAFKFSAIDYLLKPFNEKEFAETCYRIKNSDEHIPLNDRLKSFSSLYYANDMDSRKIPVHTADKVLFIKIVDIVWLESEKNYTGIHTIANKKYLIPKTLGEFEEIFEPFGFFRIHNSYLVNLRFIDYFDKAGGNVLTMTDGSIIPVATRRKTSLIKLLNKF